MISYLGSLVQFSPAAGRRRAGRCRQMSLCVGSTRRVLARQPGVLAASPWVWRAFYPHRKQPRRPEVQAASPQVLRAFSLRGERLGQPEVCGRSPRVRRAFSLRGERPGQPEAWRPLPRARCTFSLRGPSARRQSGLRKSPDRNRGLFAGWEGVASLGLSLPLFPPPASYLQWG